MYLLSLMSCVPIPSCFSLSRQGLFLYGLKIAVKRAPVWESSSLQHPDVARNWMQVPCQRSLCQPQGRFRPLQPRQLRSRPPLEPRPPMSLSSTVLPLASAGASACPFCLLCYASRSYVFFSALRLGQLADVLIVQL